MSNETDSYDAERSALMGYFQAIFVQAGVQDDEGNPVPFLPVVEMPNRRQPQPGEGAFVNVSVQAGRPFTRTVGTTASRSTGFFTVEVLIPEGTGTKVARQAAGVIAASFTNFRLVIPTGRIRFFEVGCRDVPSGMDGFGKVNVEVAYWTDKNATGVVEPLFSVQENIDRGYVVVAPGAPPAQLPTTLGLAYASNTALDAEGNIILRNSTTSAFSYLAMQGQPGAEVILALDTYTGNQKNLSTDAAGNMLLYNETTSAYSYPFIRGANNAAAVVASAQWTLTAKNWSKDANGNLLLYNVTTQAYQPVSFRGQPGAQSIQPNAP